MSHEGRPRSGVLPLLLAFAGGALVGGIAAALLAPRSGAETRRRLAEAMGTRAGSRLPGALRAASKAGQAAFALALEDGARGEARSGVAAPPLPGTGG